MCLCCVTLWSFLARPHTSLFLFACFCPQKRLAPFYVLLLWRSSTHTANQAPNLSSNLARSCTAVLPTRLGATISWTICSLIAISPTLLPGRLWSVDNYWPKMYFVGCYLLRFFIKSHRDVLMWCIDQPHGSLWQPCHAWSEWLHECLICTGGCLIVIFPNFMDVSFRLADPHSKAGSLVVQQR